jgi:hypothetical protein
MRPLIPCCKMTSPWLTPAAVPSQRVCGFSPGCDSRRGCHANSEYSPNQCCHRPYRRRSGPGVSRVCYSGFDIRRSCRNRCRARLVYRVLSTLRFRFGRTNIRFSRRSLIFFSKFAITPAFIGAANTALRSRDRPCTRVLSKIRFRSGSESAERRCAVVEIPA